MSNLQTFADYAAAFEDTYADDNWARLEQFFTKDAVYLPGDGTEAAGRGNVLQALENSVNSLDRTFDSRSLAEGPPPTEEGDVVTLIWTLVLSKQGKPDLRLSGRELLTFSGGAIKRMEDIFDEGTVDNMGAWMSEHGGAAS